MKKKICIAWAIDILKIIFWVVIFYIVQKWVLQSLKIYEVKEITKISYEAYRNNIQLMGRIAAGLTIVWWGVSLIPFPGREWMENSAGICALMSVVLYFGFSVWSYFRVPGVIREGGTVISLWYVFLYPCVYTAVLYLAPPNNICRVLTPVRWYFRFGVALIAAAVGVFGYII